MRAPVYSMPPVVVCCGLLLLGCGGGRSESATAGADVKEEQESEESVASAGGDRDGTEGVQAEQAYGPADGATFEILRVEVLEKASSLEGVERNDFSPLSEEDWNRLPRLVEIEFEFVPTQGNTEDLGNTFLLRPEDMAVRVEGEEFPSIGAVSRFGERELSQRIPFNVAGDEYPDGTLDYCGMGCPESTMWFLVPEGTTELELAYRGTPVARGTVEP